MTIDSQDLIKYLESRLIEEADSYDKLVNLGIRFAIDSIAIYEEKCGLEIAKNMDTEDVNVNQVA
ncbi:MAG: hypothetical protein KKC77_19795 [Proteobacteria bacterium]|nr:hypothetical protein [Pseudomonadota bacterium]